MPKFRYTEWQNVASEVQTLRLTVLDQLNSFKEAQQAFQSAGKLSGTGWDSTKSYFDAYSEVSTTVGNALNTLDDAITSYLSAFTSEVGPAENDLDTAKMEGLKAELRRLQAENDVIMEALAKAFEDVPFVNQFFNKQSMLGTAKKIEILEKYSAFEAAHGSDFSDVQTVIASIAEGLAFLGSAGNFSGGKDGYKTIDFKNQKWYKALKDFNKAQPKDRIDVVIKELSNGVEYQIYRNGKLDVQKTKELHELFCVHNVELFKEYGPEIFKILTNIDDIEILLAKDSTTMQRSSSGVFLLLAVLPIDRVKDILKSAKLLRNGDYTLDAVKLTVKEWEALKEFEKSADVVKTVDRGKDVGKASGVGNLKSPELGNKLDYLFGKAKGNKHNIQRSQTMQSELSKIGIYDTPNSREFLNNHLKDAINDSSNILKTETRSYVAKELPGLPTVNYTTTVRESFLKGPSGGVKIESVWDGDRLLTIIVKGGK
ncbi:hypothetical protein UAY_02969 [Enterococcus moraviensis ATCC BAA-383]|uniref:LXG domain-containing protein n=1 Tax=Enterococcus moraviensis ATCC BAA-383 TaxID=1158609 RepID=R2SUW0_9ENTE|nr:T7SS effector LXG polymorphic toxin [Enterococcus moraviensis]EOH96601.1 hypothetical protein UAY_02969 [Enterococcus moraviensis ATCC BAA-383]EOT66027.1 hypothetical protein I586_02296 [Enterococcus moraviensis ATCC BAA-383]